MSESRSSPVFMFDNSDPEMQRAYEQARGTFRFFWREMAWERRRIVPAMDLACVKVAIADGPQETGTESDSRPEYMWLGDVDFDGQTVSGVLQDEPHWLKSIKAGDPVRIPLRGISDWIYVIDEEAYGAFTVHVLRSRMDPRKRKEHDAAWGLNFGKEPRVVPQRNGWFPGRDVESQEHPMSENMAPSFKEQLSEDPSMVNQKDEVGWTLLHHQALAGSLATVTVLLECGADVNAVTDHGMTPVQLARSLGWDKVEALLASKGATG
jgi:uncharacterized protein YegJ (DUF2314 family)